MIKKSEQRKVDVSRNVKKTGRGNVKWDQEFFNALADGYAHCRMICENEEAQDWVFIAVNDSFENSIGLKGIVGKRVTEVAPDIRQTPAGLWETCLRVSLSGQPEKVEIFIASQRAWYSVSLFSPRKKELAAIFHVITAGKDDESKLRERMEYFRTVANFTYDWEYWLDSNRRILYTSPSCERITGYQVGKFEQDPSLLERIVHPDDLSVYKRHSQEEGEKAEPLSLDFRIITAGGETRWINHACQRVHDAGGRPMGRRASNRDVTERRQMEQALLENESILNMSEEVAQTGSWRLDLRTKKAAWSDQMFRLFGVERAGFDGEMKRVIAERVHPDDAVAVHEFNRSILKGISSVASLTFRIVLPDGTQRTVRTHGKLVRDDAGQPLSMTGYVQEVSEWVRVKNQFQQMRRLHATLSQVNRAAARARDATSLYSSICEAAAKHGELAAVWIEILDEASGELRPISASGLDVNQWPLPIVNLNRKSNQNGVVVEAFRNSRVAASEDLQTDERTKSLYRYFGKFEFRSLASAPIQLRGKTVGILNVASTEAGFFKAEEEIGLVEEIGLAVSFALEKGETLRESEGKMQSIFRAAPTGIGVVKDRVLVDVNPRLCEMTGYSKNELIGQSARMLYPTQEEFDFVGREKYRQIAEKGTGRVETRWLKKDGSVIEVLLASTPIDVEDLAKGVTFTALEITDRKQAEKALRQSEERFRMLFDKAPLGYQSLDAEGRFIDVNQAWLDTLGYSREEVMGRWFGEFLSPGYVDAFRKRFPLFKAAGQIHSEFEMLHKDGSKRWIAFDGRIGYELNGEFKQTHCILQDVTERRNAEEALRESEDKFKYVFDNSTVAKSITAVNNTLHANQAFCEMVGYSMEELENKPWREITHPEDIKLNEKEVGEILAGKKETSRFIKRYIHKNGSVVWVDLNTSLRRDANGKPLYFVTTALDITERKRAEEVLRESEDKFRKAFMTSPDSVNINRLEDGKYTSINPGFTQVTGYTEADVIGKTSLELNIWEDPQDRARLVEGLRKDGFVNNLEACFRKKDGSTNYGLMSAAIIELGGIPHILSITRDITERKQAEEALRQSERQMKALLTSLDDVVFEFDKNGTYLNIWAADESLLVMPKAQMLGRNVLEVMGREQGAPFEDVVKHSLDGNIPQSIEYPLEVIGGKRWFMARVSPILSHDGSIHTVSVLVRDITEHKRIEEQVQIQLQRVRALNEIDRAISSSLDMRLSLDILLTQTLSQLGVDAACVLLLNSYAQTLEYITGKGFHSTAIRDSRILLGQSFPGQAGLERKTLRVADIKAEEDKFIRKKLLHDEGFVEYFCVPLVAKGMLKGVLEVFHRSHLSPDVEWMDYLETLGGQAAIAIDNAQLFEGMQRSNLELVTAYDATIEGWSRAMDLRDKETEGHTLRVTEATTKLAKKLGIGQHEITHMRRGALLHDIGKLGVPDHILHKAGELERLEWAVMRQHPTYAFNMLLPITYLRPALDIPYCHHEKWDGSGYPRGLKGEEIPVAARIFAVVDVWDALRSDRPYRAGWDDEKVRQYLIEKSGKHFDPQIVTVFLQLIDENEL
jgi:PAS domain S-box-containing protein